jgi:hypothetical protein
VSLSIGGFALVIEGKCAESPDLLDRSDVFTLCQLLMDDGTMTWWYVHVSAIFATRT